MLPPKVSYSDLEEAFLFADESRHYWLDRLTGKVISYSSEAAEAVEEGDLSDLPDWMEDEVEAARAVLRAFGELPEEDKHSPVASSPSSVDGSAPGLELGDQENVLDNSAAEPNRYVRVEQIPSHEAFQFMADFVDVVSDSRAVEALNRSLSGNKPFRRFKDALLDFPKEREQWFEYEASRRREFIEEWARDQGIELDFGEDVS